MPPISAETIAIISLITSFALGILQVVKAKPKPKSEVRADDAMSAEAISQAWKEYVAPLRATLAELQKTQVEQQEQIERLEVKVAELRRGALLLVDQIERAGLSPVWRPQ